ncbi:cytochrome D ubiquinol oxidase subunit III [Lonsdalea britannica]|uniref:Z-ring associated protein ZapG n=1 Tax=Lonsdalea britannica TaxID=1082704 RepID=UPI000A1DD13B|nr:Z-ring associated protein ZapG [Lonsdalea britannica]OSN09247.1 cytochrome D ubiquinol oxidase subunit III [Lonsdalea britannica]
MTWEYALIGFVIGVIIGAVAMRYGNRKLRQQQVLQHELEKSKADLEQYRQELVSHFARSAELLDNMADDYRKLYQHMAKSSNDLLPEGPSRENPFNYRLTEAESDNDQVPVKMPPRDYSESASGLLRGETPLRK